MINDWIYWIKFRTHNKWTGENCTIRWYHVMDFALKFKRELISNSLFLWSNWKFTIILAMISITNIRTNNTCLECTQQCSCFLFNTFTTYTNAYVEGKHSSAFFALLSLQTTSNGEEFLYIHTQHNYALQTYAYQRSVKTCLQFT